MASCSASNKYVCNTLLNLAPRTLQVLDYFVPPNTDLLNKKDLDLGSSGPATFPYRTWEIIAAAGKDATVYLLDAKSLGGNAPSHAVIWTALRQR